MGLLSSSTRRTEQNFDQRQVNDASGGGIAGNTGTINITSSGDRVMADGIKLASSAQKQALDLAKAALGSGDGNRVALAALAVAAVGLVAFAAFARR